MDGSTRKKPERPPFRLNDSPFRIIPKGGKRQVAAGLSGAALDGLTIEDYIGWGFGLILPLTECCLMRHSDTEDEVL